MQEVYGIEVFDRSGYKINIIIIKITSARIDIYRDKNGTFKAISVLQFTVFNFIVQSLMRYKERQDKYLPKTGPFWIMQAPV